MIKVCRFFIIYAFSSLSDRRGWLYISLRRRAVEKAWLGLKPDVLVRIYVASFLRGILIQYMRLYLYTYMSVVDDELAFAMGAKLNIGETQWLKLLSRQEAVRQALYTGKGDFIGLYNECQDANTTYLRLIPFDKDDTIEARISRLLQKAVAPGIGVVKALEYSLLAYNSIVELLEGCPDEDSGTDAL